jgi:OPA family glycerol-3-phosphate transporter-like MFS transporter
MTQSTSIELAGSPPGFRRAQWRMLLATMFCYLFYYTGRQNFGFAIQGIKHDLGIGEATLAWVVTAGLWTYAIGQAVNGNLGDKFGGRRLMSLGAVLSCLLNWITSFGQSLGGLVIPWGANGYVQAFGWAPGSRVVSNWWPRRRRGIAFGFYMVAAATSTILTYALCTLIVNELGWRWLFRLPVLLMLVGGGVYFLVARNRPEDLGYPPLPEEDDDGQKADDGESSWQRYAHVLKNGPFLVACVAIGFQSAARYGLLIWVPNHYLGSEWKTNPDTLWIAMALPIGMAFGAFCGGQVTDRLFHSNRKWPIFIFMTLCAAISWGLYVVPDHYRLALIVLLFLAGFCVYAPQASFWPLCPEMLGVRRAGTGVGVMDMFAYAVGGLVQVLIGRTVETTGESGFVFAIVAGASILSAVCILGVKGKSAVVNHTGE